MYFVLSHLHVHSSNLVINISAGLQFFNYVKSLEITCTAHLSLANLAQKRLMSHREHQCGANCLKILF
jgi:hypothetical protein